MIYFGCNSGSLGHFLYSRGWHYVEGIPGTSMSAADIDCRFPPGMEGVPPNRRWDTPRDQTQGRARLVHVDGWTVLAFWDRSRDRRWNSNSAFLSPGTKSFEVMMAEARVAFPEVLERLAKCGVEIHLAPERV